MLSNILIKGRSKTSCGLMISVTENRWTKWCSSHMPWRGFHYVQRVHGGDKPLSGEIVTVQVGGGNENRAVVVGGGDGGGKM